MLGRRGVKQTGREDEEGRDGGLGGEEKVK